MVVHQRKSHRRAAAVAAIDDQLAHIVDALPVTPQLPPLSGIQMQGTSLDPSAGELDEDRADRKRNQILSTASYALQLLRPGDHVVEFGAGQGHLGLLIAHARADVFVTLVEIKEYSCEGARQRVAALNMSNCTVFCGTVDDFAASGARLECAVGLHLCGLLTDSVLELAAARRAAVCLVPCCYGQIVGGTDHDRGGGTMPCMHPRSTPFRTTLQLGSDDAPALRSAGEEAFRTIARAADTAVVGAGGSFDPSSAASVAARRCMRIVDSDRCLHILETWGAADICAECDGSVGSEESAEKPGPRPLVSVGSLQPLTCTPKSSLILIQRPESTKPLPAPMPGGYSVGCVSSRIGLDRSFES